MVPFSRLSYVWCYLRHPLTKFPAVPNETINFCYRPTTQCCKEAFRRKLPCGAEFSPLLSMGISGQIVTCRLDELRLHPSYIRHQLRVSVSNLSAVAEQGEEAFLEPLAITRELVVIDGYARLEFARRQGRIALPCIEYDLTEEEALRRLLQRLRRRNGSSDFTEYCWHWI